MAADGSRLVMPADEYAIVTGQWRKWPPSPLRTALEAAMADAVAAEKARADRAEVRLAEIAQVAGRCRQWAGLASTDETYESAQERALADAGRAILAILDGIKEADPKPGQEQQREG